jgi:hypothetical protein
MHARKSFGTFLEPIVKAQNAVNIVPEIEFKFTDAIRYSRRRCPGQSLFGGETGQILCSGSVRTRNSTLEEPNPPVLPQSDQFSGVAATPVWPEQDLVAVLHLEPPSGAGLTAAAVCPHPVQRTIHSSLPTCPSPNRTSPLSLMERTFEKGKERPQFIT